ncbi:MAG TPA: DUF3617 domain-containing protein [Thermoanaerobaculia bacterium]
MRGIAVLAVALFAFPLIAADSPQKPGKWKISMQTEIPGFPIKMPAVNTEICVTEEDLKDPNKAVPNDPKSDCKVSDYKVDGNTVSWTIDCPKQKTSGVGEATYTDESFTGTTKMKMQDQDMTVKYSGKWLGTCEKKK